jgi:predicted nucleic acid-binding protein
VASGRFVVNASPLIFLGQIGQLPLLTTLADEVVIPMAALAEVAAGDPDGSLVRAIEQNGSLQLAPDIPLPDLVSGWDLGAGESQVLALALTFHAAECVLDDRQARRCAKTLDLPTLGTFGLILRARRLGVIDQARPLLERLLELGMYLDPRLVESGLGDVGE